MVDVFISFKNSHQGKLTPDQFMAADLFNGLKEQGIKAFFSNSSLSEKGESEFKQAIDNALSEAKVLILVGTKKEFVTSKWVQYEWDTFQQEIMGERKQDGKIFTYLDGMSVSDLPIGLRQYQSFTTQTPLATIVEYIKNALRSCSCEKSKGSFVEGVFAYYGINQKIDYKKAFDILSCYNTDATALYLLGQIHYYGDISDKDLEKAMNLYSTSAEQGNIIAGYKLAECYKKGLGSEVDFAKHDEIKSKLIVEYNKYINTINDPHYEYSNNLVYLGETDKNKITKEAILAMEIKTILDLLGIKVELFDVSIDSESKKKRIEEIRVEKNMFIFSTLKNINDGRMETIWKNIFEKKEMSPKSMITYISKIQVHDIPAYLRRAPFIMRDETCMRKIVDFFMRGKEDDRPQ